MPPVFDESAHCYQRQVKSVHRGFPPHTRAELGRHLPPTPTAHPGVISSGTNVRFPQVLVPQAFPTSRHPHPSCRLYSTKVHFVASAKSSQSAAAFPHRLALGCTDTGHQPRFTPGTTATGTNVHFPQVLVPQAFPPSRPLYPACRPYSTKVHIVTSAQARQSAEAFPEPPIPGYIDTWPRRHLPVNPPHVRRSCHWNECALSSNPCPTGLPDVATAAPRVPPALYESAHCYQRLPDPAA